MELKILVNSSIKDFLVSNKILFEENLLAEAINVKDKIEEILKIGNINLLNNAHKLVKYVVEEREHELILFAKQEGVSWAKYSLTIAFKLEWVQAIRRTLWEFLYNYELKRNLNSSRKDFFTLEKNINQLIDQFLTYFFISYTKYKDELLETQRKLMENLSIPIIPISKEVYILPLIGDIDMVRMTTIEDKVLSSIENTHIQTLIIDFSGVSHIDENVYNYLIKIINGIFMMGCKSVLTGLHVEIVKVMIHLGLSTEHMVEYKGNLQFALKDYVSV